MAWREEQNEMRIIGDMVDRQNRAVKNKGLEAWKLYL